MFVTDEKPNDLYCSPNIRVMKSRMGWEKHVARTGQRSLVRKPEGKRTLGRSRRRWEDHINMDHQEVGWGGMY